MPSSVVGIMLATGVAAWVYAKLNRSTGGNMTSSLIVAGIAGIFAFVIIVLVLNMIDGK